MAVAEGNPAPITITKPKAILAEGKDVQLFLRHACNQMGITDVEVFDFTSTSNLLKYLKVFVVTPNFEAVRSLMLARDAEDNPQSAWDSASNALEKCGLGKPSAPFFLKNGTPSTGILLFPVHQDQDTTKPLLSGSLEDTCLATIANDALLKCVDSYLECANRIGDKPHPRKARLHAYLAGKRDHVGMKIGEATKAGAWNLDHPSFSRFKEVLFAM